MSRIEIVRVICIAKFKALNTFVVFIILILFSTCKTSDKPKIALMVRTLDVEIFQRQREFFITKVKEMNGEPIVISADNNDQTQIKQAEELIKQDVRALIVFPVNMYTSATIVRAAHKKK